MELADFIIDNLIERKESELQSGRPSRYRINVGLIDNAQKGEYIGQELADEIMSKSPIQPTLIFGVADKGIGLMHNVIRSINSRPGYKNLRFANDRKFPKAHGEATNTENLQDKYIIGARISSGDTIVLTDDTLTTGGSLSRVIKLIKKIEPKTNIPCVAILYDRQEVNLDGDDALKSFENEHGLKVIYLRRATNLYERALERRDIDLADRISFQLLHFGTEEAKGKLNEL